MLRRAVDDILHPPPREGRAVPGEVRVVAGRLRAAEAPDGVVVIVVGAAHGRPSGSQRLLHNETKLCQHNIEISISALVGIV